MTPRSRFAANLERAILASCLTQQEVAIKLGYSNPNIITMFKQGTTRVPLDKVVPLARALDLDPGELLREWFATYTPDALPHLQDYLGMLLSSAEKSWVQGLRRHVGPVPVWDDRWAEGLKALVDDTE
jgi:transcriptional regulator with XRE-family HTH domain